MYKIIRTDKADEQMREIIFYIADDSGSVDVALDYLGKMEAALKNLEDFPYSGSILKYAILRRQGYRVPKSYKIESKQRKVADGYVRLCAYRPGDNQWSDHNGLILDEIAKQPGTSKTNLKRALRMERNLIDSMKELSDTVKKNSIPAVIER